MPPGGMKRIFNAVNHFTHVALTHSLLPSLSVSPSLRNRVTKVHTVRPDPRVSPEHQAYPDWRDNRAMAMAPRANVARKVKRVCAADAAALDPLDQLDRLASRDPPVILDTR